MRAYLPKRKIAAQHAYSRLRERLSQPDQQGCLAVSARAMCQHQAVT